MLKKYFGDKAFYALLLSVALPMMLQNGITNFVSLLDNIMVGSLGQYEMGGVSVANQLTFVFNLCLFGAVSGVGIYSAQFYGKGDNRGIRFSLVFKIILCLVITVIGVILFLTVGDSLISAYLQGEGTLEDAETAFNSAKSYLLVMLVGFVPFALTQSYSSTLRESGETVLPMKAGIVAVFVNLVFNYLLIYGFEPFCIPKLGVVGAAIATTLSRFVEATIIIVWTHTHKQKCPYAEHFWSGFKIPFALAKNMLFKAIPLIFNEAFWALGVATVNQCYSERGLDVVAANNISSTFWNVISVAFLAGGNAIGIIIGNMLGAGKTEEAKQATPKFTVFSLLIGIAVAVICAASAPFVPYLFKATDEVRSLATGLLLVTAVTIPFNAVAHSSYFIMRSGGNAFVTFAFDGGFMWGVSVPLGFILSRFTAIPILPLYFAVQGVYFIKSAFGLLLIKNDWWAKRIID